ncbi:MAG: DNA mismatch repair protein MutS [Chlamydiae bacterium]|nr:DNA mismatch repair protein MutS [Chlamydiota bacterium]
MTTATAPTPMMAQWLACKENSKDAILLFQMGDFYEAFYDDAIVLSKVLDLTLTKRQEIPMAGVPLHTCEGYVDRLVSKGYRVAIAEQTEDPSTTKGLVNREVIRVITPGTVMNSSLIADNANNFFASLTQVGSILGLSFVDLSTGEFRVSEFESESDLLNEIYRLHPAEFLTSQKFRDKHPILIDELKQTYKFLLTVQEDWKFEHQLCCGQLTSHFQVLSLDGFGLNGKVAGINAAGALLTYLKDILLHNTDHILELTPYSTSQYMVLDFMTQRNLELTHALHQGCTLLDVLDQTVTPMGGRMIRHWIKQPLLSIPEVESRQDAIEELMHYSAIVKTLQEKLQNVRDIERLISKISGNYASPKDLVALRRSFEAIPEIKQELNALTSPLIQEIEKNLNALPDMTGLIARAIVDEPPLRVSDGNIIREGYHQELDELRRICKDNKDWIACYQTHLREQLNIKTLKIGFNRMFGYYIEVSKGQTDKMPSTFIRRQTLVNSERYISPELKSYETKVLTAEDKIGGIETELFTTVKSEVSRYTNQVTKVARHLAQLDCLRSLAEVAQMRGYCRPQVHSGTNITITDGRHPVIELSTTGSSFIPNDTHLNEDSDRLFLITGPNMSGKSTYIRQVALITIMAQMGSYVPAKEASIGIVDKVFTRIGASDDLSRGQSTFMVEMTETANILHNATERSLVILDEIGRGTSTYDGISIAWAVAEYLLTAEGKKAKTLFATHYWELTKLEEKVPGAVNYNVAVQECDDQVVFLHKIVKGSTDKSYGIHVARLAGMPSWVLERSSEILDHLEENANRKSAFEPQKAKKAPAKSRSRESDYQLLLFDKK